MKRLAIRIVVLAALALAFPWIAAYGIRALFVHNDHVALEIGERYPPAKPVREWNGIPYGVGELKLNAFAPESGGPVRPLVVWIHGGGWLSGSRATITPVAKQLAGAGFAVAVPDYTLAPTARYPESTRELSTALAYLSAHAAEYGGDARRIILAGDSAGANLAGSLAALATNPEAVKKTGIAAPLAANVVRGTVFDCGLFDLPRFDADTREHLAFRLFFGELFWAYFGSFSLSQPALALASPQHLASAAFPPSFITGGNADKLTDVQSKPFADRLRSLGVRTETLFYPDDHSPGLKHEYVRNLDRAEARTALEKIAAFIRSVTEPSPVPNGH
ncbi:MAG: alpha/beta hydrolase [Bdellovibrionales bacterium]|nr:alpha/beta hydrolase [Bdellovibrionales bacterium]